MSKETDRLIQADDIEPGIQTATVLPEYGQVGETPGIDEAPTGQITDITYNQVEQDSSLQRHQANKTRGFDPNSIDDLAGTIKKRPNWRDRMACTSQTRLFIPPTGSERKQTAADRIARALAICRTCGVRPQCYASAMLSNVNFKKNVVVAGQLGQDIADLREKIR